MSSIDSPTRISSFRKRYNWKRTETNSLTSSSSAGFFIFDEIHKFANTQFCFLLQKLWKIALSTIILITLFEGIQTQIQNSQLSLKKILFLKEATFSFGRKPLFYFTIRYFPLYLFLFLNSCALVDVRSILCNSVDRNFCVNFLFLLYLCYVPSLILRCITFKNDTIFFLFFQ